MSTSQTITKESGSNTPLGFANNVYDSIKTAKYVKTEAGRVIELTGMAVAGSYLQILQINDGTYERPDVAYWTVSAPAGSVSAITSGNSGIETDGSGLTFSSDPITTVGSIALADSGVAPAVYGSATRIPIITFDSRGRATAASSTLTSPITVSGIDGLNGGGVVNLGGAVAVGMPNVGSAGTYGSSTQIPVITTDAKGRVSNVSQVAPLPSGVVSVGSGVSGAPAGSSGLTFSADPITSSGTLALSSTGVSSGVYGSNVNVPQLTVDSTGRLTSVVNIPISASGFSLGTGVSGASTSGSGLTLSPNPITSAGTIALSSTGVGVQTFNTRDVNINCTIDGTGRFTSFAKNNKPSAGITTKITGAVFPTTQRMNSDLGIWDQGGIITAVDGSFTLLQDNIYSLSGYVSCTFTNVAGVVRIFARIIQLNNILASTVCSGGCELTLPSNGDSLDIPLTAMIKTGSTGLQQAWIEVFSASAFDADLVGRFFVAHI